MSRSGPILPDHKYDSSKGKKNEMVEGNSLRDEVKDAVRACLIESGIGQGKADEMTYDLADAVFDTLAISAEYQDKNYEHVIAEFINYF